MSEKTDSNQYSDNNKKRIHVLANFLPIYLDESKRFTVLITGIRIRSNKIWIRAAMFVPGLKLQSLFIVLIQI